MAVGEVLITKILGSVLGSSVALAFADKGSAPTLLIKRFAVGVVVGVTCSPFLIDYFNLEHSIDYWLACSTSTGALGYYVLSKLFSDRLFHRFFKQE